VKIRHLLSVYRDLPLLDAVRVSRSTISSWRNGHSLPNLAHIPALSKFLRIPEDELAKIIIDEHRELQEENSCAA
jgi:transcriptional regulator with XRE-family HTH domain